MCHKNSFCTTVRYLWVFTVSQLCWTVLGKSWTPGTVRSWTKGWAWGGNRELWYWRHTQNTDCSSDVCSFLTIFFPLLFENGKVALKILCSFNNLIIYLKVEAFADNAFYWVFKAPQNPRCSASQHCLYKEVMHHAFITCLQEHCHLGLEDCHFN